MQASTDVAASTQSEGTAHPAPLVGALSDGSAPQKDDSTLTALWGDANLCQTADTGGRKVVSRVPQEAEPCDDAFSGMTDLAWDTGRRISDSPRPILDFNGIDDLILDTSFLNAPPSPSLFSEWTSDWELNFGKDAPATFSNLPHTYAVCDRARSLERAGHVNDISTSSCASTASTCAAEPASPISLPSISIITGPNRRRRDSSSSRSSWTTNQSQLRSSCSDPLKRRISPLKQPKATPKEPSDLFPCEACERTFRYKKDLDRHALSVHIKQSSWFCPAPECKFATRGFSRKDKAFQHVKTHRSESDAGLQPIFDADSASMRGVLSTMSAPVSPSMHSTCHSFTIPQASRGPHFGGGTGRSLSQREGQVFARKNLDLHADSHSDYNLEFANLDLLRRHTETPRTDHEASAGYTCAFTGCKAAGKLWLRLDRFRQHIHRKHGSENIDVLVWKSARWRHQSRDDSSAMITTSRPQEAGSHILGGSSVSSMIRAESVPATSRLEYGRNEEEEGELYRN